MGLIAWIVVGGIAGWLASLVMNTNDQQGCLMNVALGVIGGLVGGFLLSFFGLGGELTGIDFRSILTAFIGALLLLFLRRWLR